MTAFIGSAWWEKPAYSVQKKAEELIRNDFGDRMMVWSEMTRILLKKGVPSEYLQTCCTQTLGYFQDLLDLFNAEIRECLIAGKAPVMDVNEFDTSMQETPQIAVKDHRVLNPDSSQRRIEIRTILSEAWKE